MTKLAAAPAADRVCPSDPHAAPAGDPRRSRWAHTGRRAFVSRRSPVARAAGRAVFEALEGRRLLTVAVANPIANTFALPGAAPTDIDLSGTFDDVDVAGPVVRLDTSLGNVDIELFDKTAPRTSQNFANYVANNLYNQTVIHQLVKGSVLQGGGYLPTGTHIQQAAPIQNEFSPDRSNLRGTVAMAKIPATDNQGNPVPGGGPDSATSEWFVNLVDNPGFDAINDGNTVFGQVINGTMATVDAIANLPTHDASAVTPVFAQLPVRNPLDAGAAPGPNDFVFVNSAGVIPDTRFLALAATSDNPSVVNPAVANGVLRLNYGPTPGSARVTVTATDAAGNTASQTFVAGIGEVQVQIGSGGVGRSVAFAEADGGRGTVSIAGGGAALVRFAGTDLALNAGRRPSLGGTVARISDITTLDTGTNTTLAVTSRGGSDRVVEVGGLTTDGPLKALAMRSARLTGDATVGGTVRTVNVGAIAGADLTLGGDPADGIQLALTLGTATDADVTSGMPIRSVRADQFLTSGDAIGTITAPGVASVTTRGPFRQSINTPGAIRGIKVGGPQAGDITADSLGSLSAAALEGGSWTFTQAFAADRTAVGKVAVRGAIARTTIRAAGNVGSLTAGSIASGRVYAGTNVSDEELPPFLPAGLEPFVSPARVASIRVAGETNQFSAAATTLGKLSLGRVQTDEAIGFGLAATRIESLVGRTADTELGPGVPLNFRPLDDQATFDAQVAAANLPLGNFEVRLF